MQYIDISEDTALHILSKHNVTIEEIFEVFFNIEEATRIRRSPRGGKRYLAQGRTEAGRYLTIAFERKKLPPERCKDTKGGGTKKNDYEKKIT
jgi:uncharacterized DUF497 family protein